MKSRELKKTLSAAGETARKTLRRETRELKKTLSAAGDTARKALRQISPHSRAAEAAQRRSATMKIATGLGWFSIGLGVVELVATRRLARAIGMQGREGLLETYGLREIASGAAILLLPETRTKSLAVWSRVAGDVMDLATLGRAAMRPWRRGHPFAAIAAVAGVTALDIACARTLGQQADAARQTTDYSHRAGIPSPPEQMRGAALKNFQQPADMRNAPQRNVNGSQLREAH